MFSNVFIKRISYVSALSLLLGTSAYGQWDTITIEEFERIDAPRFVRFTVDQEPPKDSKAWEKFHPKNEMSMRAMREIPVLKEFFEAHQIVSPVPPEDSFPFDRLYKDLKNLVASYLDDYSLNSFALSSKANWEATQNFPRRKEVRREIDEQDKKEEEKNRERLLRLDLKVDICQEVHSTDCSRLIEFLFLTEENELEKKGEKYASFSKRVYALEADYLEKCAAHKRSYSVEFDTILKCVAILKAKLAIPTEECFEGLVHLYLNRGISAHMLFHLFEGKESWWKDAKKAERSTLPFFKILAPFLIDFPDYFTREALERIGEDNLEESLASLNQGLTKHKELLKKINRMRPWRRSRDASYTVPDYLEVFEDPQLIREEVWNTAVKLELLHYYWHPDTFFEILNGLNSLSIQNLNFVFQEIERERLDKPFLLYSHLESLCEASKHNLLRSPLMPVLEVVEKKYLPDNVGDLTFLNQIKDGRELALVLNHITDEGLDLGCRYGLLREGKTANELVELLRILKSINFNEFVLKLAQKHGLLNENSESKDLEPILVAIYGSGEKAEEVILLVKKTKIFTQMTSGEDIGKFIKCIGNFKRRGKDSELEGAIDYVESHFGKPSFHWSLVPYSKSKREKLYELAAPLPQGGTGFVVEVVAELGEEAEEVVGLAQSFRLLDKSATAQGVETILKGLKGIYGDRKEICYLASPLFRHCSTENDFRNLFFTLNSLGEDAEEIIHLSQQYQYKLVELSSTAEDVEIILRGLNVLEGDRTEICELASPLFRYCSTKNDVVNLLITLDELGKEAKEIVDLIINKRLLNENMKERDISDLLEGLKKIKGDRVALCEAMRPLLRESLQGDEIVDILKAGKKLYINRKVIVKNALKHGLITEAHFQKVKRHPGHDATKTLYLPEIIETLHATPIWVDDLDEIFQVVKEISVDLTEWPHLLFAIRRMGGDFSKVREVPQDVLRKGMGLVDKVRILEAVENLEDDRDSICRQASWFIKEGMNHQDVEHILKGIEELRDKAPEVIQNVEESGLIQDHMNGYGRKQILRVVGEIGPDFKAIMEKTKHLINPSMSGRDVAHVLREAAQE